MYTHRATTGRIIFIDTDNQWSGTYDSSDNFYGLSMQMLNTEKMVPNSGSEVAMSPVRVVLADNLEFDRDGALLPVSSLNTLVPLTEVKLAIISASDSEIVVYATIACDGTALEGLVNGDFILYDADGVAQAISGVAEGDPGVYTLSGTGLVSGTVITAAPADLSVPAYESFATTVTVTS
jgi:hypothetical protein